MASLIISFMADDRPGLVETLSSIVSEQQGNWLASRMSHLAGKFAGIVQVQVADQHADALSNNVQALEKDGWTISLEKTEPQAQAPQACAKLSIVGNDRPGIVKEVSQALAKLHVNVLELNTQFESAAMTAEALFKTQAEISLPQGLELIEVSDELENLSNDLMVEISAA